MFSFRRKSSKKGKEDSQPRKSPSLPELTSQGIPWPENLVDVASIRQTPPPDHPQQGATRTSLKGGSHSPIPFHKPFRVSIGKRPNGGIFSLYMSSPPSAFDRNKNALSAGRYTQRRARVPPTFNLMIIGSRGTGKTSLLRLLLETADISPGATADQLAAVDRFLRGTPKHTESIQTACVEICESRFDRILFSVIDTPGLDFGEGRELKLERQISGILKYIDAQYADTMSEESKVVRQSKGDQHIHLCIYLIDPSSIMTATQHHALSSLPTKTRSETTISYRVSEAPDDATEDTEDESEAELVMSPVELRVIRRLSARCNLLPVIGHADSLTDEKLAAVKNAVRKTLHQAGLDFGVFGPGSLQKGTPDVPQRQTRFSDANGNGNGHAEETSDGEEEERQSRSVVKLRPSRNRTPSRSRSRRDLSEAATDEHRPVTPDAADTESVANVRFNAHIIAKADLSTLMPFALIAPESNRRPPRPVSTTSQLSSIPPASPAPPSEDGHTPSIDTTPGTAASTHSTRLSSYYQGPPDDMKGVFIRRYRWGTIDVLNPDHCDFAALRTAILSTHLKLLKVHTKEVLYEKYRTEKLLARRATSGITDEEQQRLLQDLGL